MSRKNSGEDLGRGRVETLSDGVFAIVLTLLVLEIKIPHIESPDSLSELSSALFALAPKFISWVISFMTVCVIWLNHHRLFTILRRIDNGIFWYNANLLLWTSFIPFPTALIGDYPHNPLSLSLYGLVMLLMALSFVLMRLHLHKHHDLLHDDFDQAVFKAGTRWAVLMGPVAYAVGVAISWIWAPLAFLWYGAIAIYFVFPHTLRVR